MAAHAMTPAPIVMDSHIMSLEFHPGDTVVAAALVTGEVRLYRYGIDANEEGPTLANHKQSCREVVFSHDGTQMYTAGADKRLAAVDVTNYQLNWTIPRAHQESINALLVLNEWALATGDDGGIIRIWDVRQQKHVYEFAENDEFIADLAIHEESKSLVAVGGDQKLSVYDLRKGTLEAMSDDMEDAMTSIAIVKNGTRVVCGSEEGVLHIFKWGYFGDVVDRFPTKIEEMDAMLTLNEDSIVVGSGDGLIRVFNIFPNQMVGILGDHENMPVDALAFSADKQIIGSAAHDNTLRFWNVNNIRLARDPQQLEALPADYHPAGGDESDEDDDDDDDDSDGAPSGSRRQQKTKMHRGQHGDGGASKRDFFADL